MKNWMYITCLYHVIFVFMEFSRNRLASDEPPLGDSSFSGLFWGSRDGTAWRKGSLRQVTHDCTPYLRVFGDDRVRGTWEQMMLQVVLVELKARAWASWETLWQRFII